MERKKKRKRLVTNMSSPLGDYRNRYLLPGKPLLFWAKSSLSLSVRGRNALGVSLEKGGAAAL